MLLSKDGFIIPHDTGSTTYKIEIPKKEIVDLEKQKSNLYENEL